MVPEGPGKRRHCGPRLEVERGVREARHQQQHHRGASAYRKPWKVWEGPCWGQRKRGGAVGLAGHPQSFREKRKPRSS